ncbi:hypothetical protein ACWEOE_10875 [Amycolatopsis sp. NPDC004368]
MLVNIDVFGDSIGRVFEPGTTDYKRAEYALNSAEGLVLSAANHEDDWTEPEDLPRVAQTIIYEVAGRKFDNPKGRLSRNVGPLAESMTREQAAGLALTTAEVAQLAPYVAPGRGGLQSVEVTRPDVVARDVIYMGDGYTGSIMRIPYADEPGSYELFPE